MFAALAVARHLQDATDVTIKKLVRTLRPLRTATIAIGPHTLTAEPLISTEARAILDRLPPINGQGTKPVQLRSGSRCATQVWVPAGRGEWRSPCWTHWLGMLICREECGV